MEKKKYSLVIADDDSAIRNGICNFIDWDSMGFSVDADFEDGAELIEYIKKRPVDVILTDIQMSEVSGLEVARYVFEHGMDTQIVILSGYKEFDYAKQAIAYQVADYLLKPVHIDELEKIFSKIYVNMEKKRRENEQTVNREREFHELLPELQEQFWMIILLGIFHDRQRIIDKRDVLSLHFSTKTPCGVISAKLVMDASVSQQYFLEKNNRYNLLNNIFAGENGGLTFHPVYLAPDNLKLVVTTEGPMNFGIFRDILSGQLQKKAEEVNCLLGLYIHLKIENVFSNIMELVEHYGDQTAQSAPGAAGGQEGHRGPEVDYEQLQQKYILIMDTIDAGDFEQLDYLVGNIFFELRERPLMETRSLLLDMFSMLQNKFMKMDPSLWKDVKEKISYQDLMSADNRETLREVCLIQLHRVVELKSKRQAETSCSMVSRVKEYLKDHYEEDISLDMLAEKYYLNSSYLSRLFRQYTGTTLTDYLTTLRIEEAKRLLLTGRYKIYEISQKVGYRNDKYFFRVFRQKTGKSPSEFLRSRIDGSR